MYFEKRDKQKKKTNKILDNMLKVKIEEKKVSRSNFYDRIVGNQKPSYTKDLSFLKEKTISPSKSFTQNLSEQREVELWNELQDIIDELERDII